MLPKRNLAANFAGQGWSAVVGLAFVPVYINQLGVEAYGLIGLYVVIQIWLSVLDLGMTPTMTRETARLDSGAHSAESIADLMRSIEFICFSIAAVIGISLWLGSGWFARHWITSETLSERVVANSLAIMGFVAAGRFCEGIYRGALYGLERQVFYNAVYAFLATLRYGGAALLVIWVPSIEAFFWWQAGLSVVTVGILATATWSFLPRATQRARFSSESLSRIGAFAGGMTLTGLFGLLFTQADKMLLTSMVDLESFGRYMLAVALGGLFPMLVGPIAAAVFPQLTSVVASGDEEGEVTLFRAATQLAAILLAPALAVCVIAGYRVMFAWTGDPELAGVVGPILALIAIGGFCHGLIMVPFMLQLAHGWTTLSIRVNIIGLLVLLPTAYFGITQFGIVGAAFAWAGSNIVVSILATIVMHRRILVLERFLFIRDAVIMPIAVSFGIVGLIIMLLWDQHGRMLNLAAVLGAGIAAVLGCCLALPEPRRLLLYLLRAGKHNDANHIQ